MPYSLYRLFRRFWPPVALVVIAVGALDKLIDTIKNW